MMATEVKEKPIYKVRHKVSGLIYILVLSDRGEGVWYIQSNDGNVPSGQYVYGTLGEVTEGNGLEIVV